MVPLILGNPCFKMRLQEALSGARKSKFLRGGYSPEPEGISARICIYVYIHTHKDIDRT